MKRDLVMNAGYVAGVLMLMWGAAIPACRAGENKGNGFEYVTWRFADGSAAPWSGADLTIEKEKTPGLQFVSGGDPRIEVRLERPLVIPGEAGIKVRMSATKSGSAQMFWGAMPQEIDSVRVPLKADGKVHEYVFPVPWDLVVGNLRFDPIDAARVRVRIESIAVPTVAARTLMARSLYWDNPSPRAGRPERLCLGLENTAAAGAECTAKLVVPEGVKVRSAAERKVTLDGKKLREIVWQVEAPGPMEGDFTVELTRAREGKCRLVIRSRFGKAKPVVKADYVPEPRPAKTDYLIGAHYFPGWKEGTHYGWGKIAPYPDRKPLLGWYDEGEPEVADWEIKWALEHGISFFVYCWYRPRANLGKPVTADGLYLGHAIHDGLMKAKYRNGFKFCIMWENGNAAGVSSMDDLTKNLFAFWMASYFKHPSYLKVDNKPVLFVYHFQNFCNQLGKTPEAVKKSVGVMREACRRAGFAGLILAAEHRGGGAHPAAKYGFDYIFPYCQARGGTRGLGGKDVATRFIPTVSMGWNQEAWGRGAGGWRATPGQFRKACEDTKKVMDTLPAGHLGRKMLVLDNWNEWGEGHYVAPHRQYGFGYLDAVRQVFCTPAAGGKEAGAAHHDLVPDDVGRGPYDRRFRGKLE